jgi:transcriptional regulator with XRE-family HTH domain
MDKEIFVQNVKFFCNRKGIPPTVACQESGVGGSFLSDVKRGRTPSVEKFQMLAQYLGVTTSQLLGEQATDEKKNTPPEKGGVSRDPLDARIMDLASSMSPAQKKALIEKMEFLISMQ